MIRVALLTLCFLGQCALAETLSPMDAINLDKASLEKFSELMKCKPSKEIPGEIPANIKNKNLSKKFGPLDLKFGLNPLDPTGNSSLKFNLDVIESFELLSSRKNLVEALAPDDQHYIISPEIKQAVKKLLLGLQPVQPPDEKHPE